jgi:23S rRNA pseudouridine1911/1915/1917 synthase
MASIGHPVVGDDRYGGPRSGSPAALAIDRPWLHAEHLAFDHPVSGEHLSFESPVPEELLTVLTQLS